MRVNHFPNTSGLAMGVLKSDIHLEYLWKD